MILKMRETLAKVWVWLTGTNVRSDLGLDEGLNDLVRMRCYGFFLGLG